MQNLVSSFKIIVFNEIKVNKVKNFQAAIHFIKTELNQTWRNAVKMRRKKFFIGLIFALDIYCVMFSVGSNMKSMSKFETLELL